MGATSQNTDLAVLSVRPYTPQDDAALCALERACKQGHRFQLGYDRKLFRARTELYEDAELCVVGSHDRPAAVGAVAFKQVRLGSRVQPMAYLYDARVHPRARRRGAGVALYEHFDQRARAKGCVGVYGLVLGDNQIILDGFARRGYEVVARYNVLVFPARRHAKRQVKNLDPEAAQLAITGAYGHRPMFTNTHPIYAAPAYLGTLSNPHAQISLWDASTLWHPVVTRMPRWLEVASALSQRIAPALGCAPLPSPGQPVRITFAFDLVANRRPQDLAPLVRAAATTALERGAHVLCCAIAATDPLAPFLKSLALTSLPCVMIWRSLVKGGPRPGANDPVTIDIRDL